MQDFLKDFYPTPKNLIYQMTRDLSLSGKTILDPSAGKGDILDYISKNSGDVYGNRILYGIEINPTLQATLIGKGYKVIDGDFLNHDPEINFDLIIMNPPFSSGVDHFLKAWEIMCNGEIVCLLNAETLKNPYSEKRKLALKIIEDNQGTIEYLHDEFIEAERSTTVEVALIKIKKTTPAPRFTFDNFETEKIDFEIDAETGVVLPNAIQNIVDRHKFARKHLEIALQNLSVVATYLKEIGEIYSSDKISLNHPHENYADIVYKMKQCQWRDIIKRLDLDKLMSSSVRTDFQAMVNSQNNMAITVANIELLVSTLYQNKQNIFQNSVESVFDKMTMYTEENRIHFEGWKTNKSYMVNRKVIMPYILDALDYKYQSYACFSTRYDSQTDDIDKSLAFLEGKKIDQVLTITEALKKRFKEIGTIQTGQTFNNQVESTYFIIKFWRKGTCHIYFKDKDLWDLFNQTACKNKNWLPPATKVKNGKVVESNEIAISNTIF